jgi:hypothetical protein
LLETYQFLFHLLEIWCRNTWMVRDNPFHIVPVTATWINHSWRWLI